MTIDPDEVLRQRIVCELRDQGFDILPQLQLPFEGVWFQGKFFYFEDINAQFWGYDKGGLR